jgi:hypothetical protein
VKIGIKMGDFGGLEVIFKDFDLVGVIDSELGEKGIKMGDFGGFV